jgi:hypothetical protein
VRPTFTPCPFLIGAMVVGALLAGCEAKLHVTSKVNGDPVTVQIPQIGGPSATVSISEMCYDGVKYIVNNKGGMAAKVSRSPEGNFRLTGC